MEAKKFAAGESLTRLERFCRLQASLLIRKKCFKATSRLEFAPRKLFCRLWISPGWRHRDKQKVWNETRRRIFSTLSCHRKLHGRLIYFFRNSRQIIRWWETINVSVLPTCLKDLPRRGWRAAANLSTFILVSTFNLKLRVFVLISPSSFRFLSSVRRIGILARAREGRNSWRLPRLRSGEM